MGTRETGSSHREEQLFHGKFCSLCQPPMSPLACGIQFIESCNCPMDNQQRIFDEWLKSHRKLFFKVVRAYAFTPQDQEDLFQEIATQVAIGP